MHQIYLPVTILTVFVLCLAIFLALQFSGLLFKPGQRKEGAHVAEVWLTWSLGRGSTMYRQRFASQKQAYYYVRFYAWLLDMTLPKAFRTTDWVGRPVWISNDMGIQYGVRPISQQEINDFKPLWSTDMPGTLDFTGEHPDLHPVFGQYSKEKLQQENAA